MKGISCLDTQKWEITAFKTPWTKHNINVQNGYEVDAPGKQVNHEKTLKIQTIAYLHCCMFDTKIRNQKHEEFTKLLIFQKM